MIHILPPDSTQSSPSRRARVDMFAGSEPWSGSVSPKQPISSPAAMPGSHCCFCSSLPYFQIAYMASEPCTLTSDRTPESAASSSMQARPYCDGGRAGAAVTGQVHAEQAELAELEGQLADRDLAAFVPVGHERPDLVVGDPAGQLADVLLLVAEQDVQVEQIQRSGHACTTSTRAWIWLRCCSAARSARCRPSSR